MLRHREDLRGLVVVLAALAIPAVEIAGLARHPLLWPVGVGCAYLALLVNHNHQHVALFRWAPANRIFDLLTTVAGGLPASALVPLHNRNHHAARDGDDDHMSTRRVARWPALLRLPAYPLVAAAAYAPARRAALRALKDGEPRVHRRIARERVALACVALGCLAWRPLRTLAYLIAPWLLAQYWAINANFLQHHGCDPDDPDGHSRDFTGRLVNWLTFNGGYHLEHHDRPGLHWSRLPAAHAERRARIPPHLIEPSFPALVVRFALGRAPRGPA